MILVSRGPPLPSVLTAAFLRGESGGGGFYAARAHQPTYQGRRVAPSMRQATRPLQRRGATGLRERLRLPQIKAPENEPITPELGFGPADSLYKTRRIPGAAGYMSCCGCMSRAGPAKRDSGLSHIKKPQTPWPPVHEH